MVERDVLKAVLAENRFDFAFEGTAPGGVLARGRGQQEAAVFQVFLQVGAFLGGEVEIAFPGHDDEGDLEEFLVGEFDGFEAPFGGDRGFLLDCC